MADFLPEVHTPPEGTHGTSREVTPSAKSRLVIQLLFFVRVVKVFLDFF